MRYLLAGGAVLGAALLGALPALAQSSPPTSPSKGDLPVPFTQVAPPGTPLTPHGTGGRGAIPPIEEQNRLARQADQAAPDEPEALLSAAQAAVQGGNFGRANELLERAATRLLTRSTLAGTERTPSGSPAVQAIAAAREAVVARDRNRAETQIRMAMDLARTMPGEDEGLTGSGGPMSPGPTGAGGATIMNTPGSGVGPAAPPLR